MWLGGHVSWYTAQRGWLDWYLYLPGPVLCDHPSGGAELSTSQQQCPANAQRILAFEHREQLRLIAVDNDSGVVASKPIPLQYQFHH